MGVLFQGFQDKDSYAVFFSKEDGAMKERRFPLHLLRHFEYAYCISIHKSQGSEFDDILIALPEGSDCFGRQSLYTAVTRAKKSIQVYGEEGVIRAVVRKEELRLSAIAERLARKMASFSEENEAK
jgi:exodeoxyribonuclease V alpha subunit